MTKTKYFSIKELVHPQILKAIGETNAWMRLDAGCLKDLDSIREAWGSSINCNVGAVDSRGLRPPNDPDGSFYSVHKQGKAFDLAPTNGKTNALREMVTEMIKDGKLKAFNTVEHKSFTPTWCHFAKMNIIGDAPYIVKP